MTPNHFLKGSWYLETDPKNVIQSPYAKLFNANLGVLFKKMGKAQELFSKILRENLLACSAKYLRKYPGQNPFQIKDVVISLKVNGYFLGEVVSVWPQYCVILSTEFKPPAEKNIHVKLLLLIHRPSLVSGAGPAQGGHSPQLSETAGQSNLDTKCSTATCSLLHTVQHNPMEILWNTFPFVTPPRDNAHFTFPILS